MQQKGGSNKPAANVVPILGSSSTWLQGPDAHHLCTQVPANGYTFDILVKHPALPSGNIGGNGPFRARVKIKHQTGRVD